MRDPNQKRVSDAVLDRRSFLVKSAKGMTGIMVLSGGLPALLSACSSRTKPGKAEGSTESMVEIGSVEEMKKGPFPLKIDYHTKIKDGWTTSEVKGFVYIIKNSEGEIYVMSPICTHLGCTVPMADEEWKKKGVMFHCPCHGGLYDAQGVNIGGPPPRPLDVFSPTIKDGKVYIQVLNPVKREPKA